MKIYTDLPQHLPDGADNPEWLLQRAGKFTGSDFYQYLHVNEKPLSATALTALHKKVLESFGESFDSVKTPAMERGILLEPVARELYIATTFADVQEVGFIDYENLNAGCSPDGVIYAEGGQIEKIIEIKCPDIVAFLKYVDAENIPTQYLVQMQFNMFITGAKECDFVAYYPGMKLIIHNIQKDATIQEQIGEALRELNVKYKNIADKIKGLKA